MFVGRRDQQIKVNGFRIETTEITNAMPSDVVRSHVMVQDGSLIAYVMPWVDQIAVKSALEERLPTYMIPRVVVPMKSFPLNKNGKIDVKNLVVAGQNLLKVLAVDDSKNTFSPIENIIRLVWKQVLHLGSNTDLSAVDNFFEKGGTSLSAVVLSRKLSEELQTDVSVQDIFACQTIRTLAATLDGSSKKSIQNPNPPAPLRFLPGGRERLHPAVFGVLQVLGLILMSLLVIGPVLGTVSVSVRAFIWFGHIGFVLFPLFLVAGCTFHMSLAILCKWLIIGRYKPGKAKMYSWLFLKWWLVRRILHVAGLYTWIFDETNVSRVWFALLGVKIGRNVSVEQPFILEPDLVTIGDDSVLEFEVQLATAEIVSGVLEFRSVTIGNRVKLGVRSVVLGGALVHDGCELLAKTSVDSSYSSTMPDQVLSGSPAKAVGEAPGELWRPRRGIGYTTLQMLGCLVQLFVLEAAIYPGAAIGLVILEKYVHPATNTLYAYCFSSRSLLSNF